MVRRAVAGILIVVASVLAPFAVGANWAQRTLTDSQRFAETIGPLADAPQVQQVVQAALSEAVIDAVDAQSRLDPLLPTRVAESVASGVNSAIQSGVEQFVEGDRFGQVWQLIAGEVQQQFVALLERDGSGAVALRDGRLVLDTGAAAEMVKAELAGRGVPFVGSIDAGLIQGEVVLAETPNLQIVLDALRIFLPVAAWLWVGVLVLLVVGILLWRPRARGTMWAGVGLLAGGVVTWVALDIGSAELVDSAGTTNRADLLEVTLGIVLRFLVNSLLVMMTLGAVLVVAGWLAGGTRSGKRMRDMLCGAIHPLGAPLADGPLGRLAARRPMLVPTLRGVVIVLAAAWLLTRETLTAGNVLWTVAAMAAALLVVEVVEGAGLAHDAQMSGALVAD